MKEKFWKLRSKLILIQVFLVLPLMVSVLCIAIYWIKDATVKEIDASRNNSLLTAANAFDQLYSRTLRLLEKPYTDNALYSIIIKKYDDNNMMSKGKDNIQVDKQLKNILYYEPNLSSITLVSELSKSTYYQKILPTTLINVHNAEWYRLTESEWYQNAMLVDTPVVFEKAENELYLSSGPTISFTQRLKDVMHNRNIGVIRIDLNLSSFYESWQQLAEVNSDSIVVLNQEDEMIYTNSTLLQEQYPIKSKVLLDEMSAKYHINHQQAPTSGYQFIYLSDELSLFRHGKILSIVGLSLFIFYIIYISIFIKWSSRYISKPVNKLKTAMIQGQKEDLAARCEPLSGEMGELSDAFNSLMEYMGRLVEESAKHEQEKAKLAYEILQSKINPHFLYNTLSAIRWRAELIGAQNISHALESLASLLRFTIKCTDDLIPFEQELQQLENYIQIMRVRYGDEIEFDFNIDEECMQYMCVKFLLQPAIENCFLHAFNGKKQGSKMIAVNIHCEEAAIRITVEDNGDGMSDEQIEEIFSDHVKENRTKFFGIGINSIKQKIAILFGEAYSLNMESKLGQYTRITVIIPKITNLTFYPQNVDEK